MLSWINSQLKAKKGVEIGIGKEVTGQLVGGHEYSVVDVGLQQQRHDRGCLAPQPMGRGHRTAGTIASAGHNDGSNDGFVFITPATLFGDTVDLASAVV